MKSGFSRLPSRAPAHYTPIAAAVLAILMASPAIGQDSASDAGERVLPRVDVIGTGAASVLNAPGSAFVIDGRTLEESRVFNVNEALRKVPGVNVRDEEGVGLRPNIGIRGMNPTRSTKTLLLEDGLPLSFAPYGDNASYYHPPIDRYDSIEVSKGSQVIRFGPQTAGGVINYLTPEPQQAFGGFVGVAGGTRGYLNGHVMVTGNGASLDYYRKESDGARENMNSKLDDLSFKWASQLNEDNKLVLRASHFREDSQLTYSGLTQAEFVNLGPRYNPFKNDHFDLNRTGLSATHELKFSADTKVLTSVYGSFFDRDWWRQASDTGTSNTALNCQGQAGQSRMNGVALTDANLNGCLMQGRLREYRTTGIDSRAQIRHNAFGIAGELEVGVKFQHEVQKRRQENYTTYTNYLAGSGMALGESQQRRTNAFSTFASNRFQFTERFAVTPIVRIEQIENQRINNLNGSRGSANFTELVPGIGATYQLSQTSLLYGGVHRGFSPPRVEDAVNSSGGSVDLNAERSVNAELGLRTSPTKDVALDVTLFRNDFSNLVQVGSIAGGSTGYQEGKALFQGVEFAGQFDKLISAVEGNLFARVAWTWLPTAEQKSAFTSGAGTGAVGNRLPYAPESLMNLTLGYRSPANWSTRLDYVYVGRQFADFDNTVAPSGNGQEGLLASYGIWNAVVNYNMGKTTLFAAAKNLTDETYIVDRTRGIQVGMPRTIQAGLKYAF